MKKMVRAVLFAVMAVFSTAVFAEDEDPCASLPGSLTFAADGYYEIGTADALYKFACMVNGGATSINGRLTADICLNACGEGESVLKADGTLNGDGSNFTQWTPIGTVEKPYTGTFDGEDAEGNVHVISGLYFNDESTEYVGLFGYIDESAKVQNVGVVDSYFKGCQYVGGVVGYSFNGTVSKVYNTGAASGETFVGGVVGYNDGGTVSNAYNTGSVSGSGNDVGGVVGANYGTVSNAYNTGSVSGSGDDVGGVVGYSFNGTVSNVYNTGSVSGNGVGVGGVVGNNYGTVSNGFFNTAYYSGNAIGESDGTADNVKGLSMTDLANLTVGNGGNFPLLEGETESPWAKGIYYDKATGKLANIKLPYLKSLKILPKPQDVEMEFNVKDNVIQISSTDDLKNFAKLVNEYHITDVDAELTTNLTVNSNLLGENNANVNAETGEYKGSAPANVWTPIGTKGKQYTGTFDGNGHTIRGLYFNDESTDYVGLFGYIGSGATVQNVGVVDSYFKGCQYVGGVVGRMEGGSISNVYNTGSVSGEYNVGGVVGRNNGVTISNAYNTGSVSGNDYVGGVVGDNSGPISNAYNTGSVSGNGYVGGVVGENYDGTISNVYNTGSVSGIYDVGGVIGYNCDGTISNVYNTGVVSGDSYVGGVVGFNGGTIGNVYNTGSVSGANDVGGVVGKKDNGDINKAYYDEQTCNNCNSYGTGKPLAELATLTIGSKADDDADFPLLEGETESPWAKGIYYDKATGKLANSNLPYLKSLPKPQDVEMEFNVKDNVIQISSTDDLKNFAKLVNEYGVTDADAELTTNLTVNSNLLGENNANVNAETGEYKGSAPANVWTPIGTKGKQYTGTFDGNGHTIRGLYFNDESTDYVGLFGYIDESAKVQNVGVVDSYFKGEFYVGGVVGFSHNGTISNVYNTGAVSGEFDYVGGVVGLNAGGTISNVYNTGAVRGNDRVGGVVGDNGGTVSNVYNTGAVSGRDIVGGVVGFVYYHSTVENAYYNTDSYTGSAIGECAGEREYENVEGKTTAELASTTLPDGFSSEIWNAGSGEPVGRNGKLLLKLPGLKDVGVQPEIEYTGFQPNADGYYEISNALELKCFAQLVNGGAIDIKGKLTANICLNACGEDESVLKADGTLNGDGSEFTQWIPIGTETQKFNGTFDGAGHTISGLYVDGAEYAGLFGYVFVDNINGEDEKGVVKNVGIEDSYISGTKYVGGVVAYNEGRTLSVYNAGNVTGSGSGCATGGVVGYNVGLVSDAYNAGAVKSSVNDCSTGGVVGLNAGFVFYVYNIGAVSGGANVGGVAGSNSSMISKAYYNTEVFTGNAVGSGNLPNPAAGKTAVELSSLEIVDLVSDKDHVGSSAWVVGSGRVVMSANKLVYKLPGLKGFSTQPEIVLMQANDQNVFEIGSAQELKWFAEYAGSGTISIKAKLTVDICLNACGAGESVLDANGTLNGDGANFEQWTPINIASMNMSLDGNGHTISGLYFRNADKDSVGFFGSLQGTVSISNLGIEDSYIEGKDNVGVFVGVNDNSSLTIANCFGAGYVKGNDYVAGFVGQSKGGLNIANSYSVSIVNGEDYTGGFIGSGALANVANSFFLNGVSNVGGTQKSADEFHDGTVAVLLHNYNKNGVNGFIWGQDLTNANSLPDFSSEFAGGTLHALTLHTFDGDTRKYPTEYVQEIGLELPKDLTRENYVFAGWSTKQVSTSMGDIVTSIAKGATDAKTFYAQWMKVSEEGVYEIATAVDLYKFAQLVNGGTTNIKGKLTADICLNACGEGEKSLLEQVAKLEAKGELLPESFKQWTPIGTTGTNKMFKGTFDGAGHTISGLYFNQDASYAGLFGRSTKNNSSKSSIKNVGVVDSYIKGKDYVGGIVGYNGNCTVSNVFSTSTVQGNEYVGGIAGYNDAGTIENAYNMGAVSGNSKVAGIAGYNLGTSAHINNVYSSGTVSGPEGRYVRGLVGYNSESKTKISNAFYNTDVFDGDAVGNVDGTNVEGMTTVELASTTLPAGFSSEIWLAGSKDVVDGKLVYKFPGLKIFDSQPEVVLFNVQKGSDGKDYCEIANADDLFKFAQLVNGGATGLNAKLTADICVNGCGEGEKSLLEQVAELEANDELSPESFQQWTPMSVSSNVTLTFDGNGHTISGLYINKEKSSQIGLFGQVVGDVSVSNLGVVDFYVNGNGEVGSLAGQVTGKLNIKNCYSAGSVKGVSYVGGIVGVNIYGAELKIENSYNESSVNAPSGIVGGFVGENFNYARLTITNSYNAGAVSGKQYVGGLVGDNYSASLTITNSYNAGAVSGEDFVGGLVGVNEDGTLNVSNSFFVETNGDGDGLAGEAKTSDEFADGTVALLLHNWCEMDGEVCKEGGLNGAIWGQVAAPREDGSVDKFPVLVLDGSGKLVFSIVAEMNGGSTKDAFATKYEYGTNYVLPIPERANYTFGGWFTDAAFTAGSGITEIVSTDFGPKNVYAKWIPVKYTIKVSVNDKAMGTVAGAGEYEYGTKVEISATAKKGYKFVKWSDGVKDAKRTITVTKAEKLTATFEKDSKKDAVVAMAQLPQFSVTASGKMVSIAGARPNTNVVVYDLQGNRVKSVVATSANFTFALPSAGVYIVKNGYTAKRVNVR